MRSLMCLTTRNTSDLLPSCFENNFCCNISWLAWVTKLKLRPSVAVYVAFTVSAALHPKVSGSGQLDTAYPSPADSWI